MDTNPLVELNVSDVVPSISSEKSYLLETDTMKDSSVVKMSIMFRLMLIKVLRN